MAPNLKALSMRVNPEVYNRFQALKDKAGIKHAPEFLQLLMDAYSRFDLDKFEYTEEEKAEIQRAESLGYSPLKLARVGLLGEARRTNRASERLQSVEDVSDLRTTVRGSAELRIDTFVKAIMAQNDQAKDSIDKVRLSTTWVQKELGANRQAINEYFEKHAAMIDAHHQKHGLGENHNRRATIERQAREARS